MSPTLIANWGLGLSQDLEDGRKDEERGERKGMQRNTRGQKSAGNSSRQPLRTGSTLFCKASPHWVLVQMQMWKRERQSAGQHDGHEGREMGREKERGNKYHPRRFLSQPLIVACVH